MRSTLKYSRYELDPEKQDGILQKMFDSFLSLKSSSSFKKYF